MEFPREPPAGGRKWYVLLCAALVPLAVLFLSIKPWEPGYDYWETASTIKEIAQNPFHPNNPIVELPGHTSPRFVPYTIFWGLFKKATGLGIFAVMAIAGLANYLLFVTGLYRYVRREFWGGSLPSTMLIVMLFAWGTGYAWANAYHLEIFLLVLPYYGTFAFALSLHALAAVRDWGDLGETRNLLIYAALSLLVFITHPITGIFCYVAALASLFARGGWRKALLIQAVPVLTLLISLAWPYFDYWKVYTSGTSLSWYWTPLLQNQLAALGPALLGLPLALWFAARRQHLVLFYGILLCGMIYAFAIATGTLIAGRFVLFGAFFLHLAIAVALWGAFRSRHAVATVLVLLLVPSLWYRGTGFRLHAERLTSDGSRVLRYESPVGRYLFLAGHLEEGNVVLKRRNGSIIPAITGAKSVTAKANPLIAAETFERNAAALAFYEETAEYEVRLDIARKYGVTHVVVDLAEEGENGDALIADLRRMGRVTGRAGEVLLFEIERAD